MPRQAACEGEGRPEEATGTSDTRSFRSSHGLGCPSSRVAQQQGSEQPAEALEREGHIHRVRDKEESVCQHRGHGRGQMVAQCSWAEWSGLVTFVCAELGCAGGSNLGRMGLARKKKIMKNYFYYYERLVPGTPTTSNCSSR